jgi:VCBS repeat protein
MLNVVRAAGWLRRLTMAGMIVCATHAACAAASAPRSTQPWVQSFVSQPLPAGVRPTDPDADLVAVVATDIDTDGDLDIVATDSDLRLYVWINDGAGHFTRREPSRLPTLRDDPAPRVEDRRTTVEALTQSDPPSVDPGAAIDIVPTAVSSYTALAGCESAAGTDLTGASPRAPPAAS